MDINEFISSVPPSFSKYLRELADLIDERPHVISQLTDVSNEVILEHLKPAETNQGELFSQAEVLAYLKTKGIVNLRPKRLSQQLKQLGFHYTDEPVWVPISGKTKRGFWCKPL